MTWTICVLGWGPLLELIVCSDTCQAHDGLMLLLLVVVVRVWCWAHAAAVTEAWAGALCHCKQALLRRLL